MKCSQIFHTYAIIYMYIQSSSNYKVIDRNTVPVENLVVGFLTRHDVFLVHALDKFSCDLDTHS